MKLSGPGNLPGPLFFWCDPVSAPGTGQWLMNPKKVLQNVPRGYGLSGEPDAAYKRTSGAEARHIVRSHGTAEAVPFRSVPPRFGVPASGRESPAGESCQHERKIRGFLHSALRAPVEMTQCGVGRERVWAKPSCSNETRPAIGDSPDETQRPDEFSPLLHR